MRRRWLMGALLGGVVLGCGPSLRMLHESTVYFERCHSAELREDVSLDTRAECWERWLRYYSEGQEPARILHARERLVFLSQGEALDPLPTPEIAEAEIGEAPPTEGALGETPPPTAPPQPEADRTPAPPPEADPYHRHPVRPSPRYHGNTVCEGVCRPRYDACIPHCDYRGRSCVQACEASYRECMRGCF